ncbi:basic salivary proline-rich protein 4-like [Neovison vison]|uniref:basic salivary proline-rich protein 4-like n=1 Tax=Neovison vison TaxID=452646 RepID=UPI001CF09FCD|nr:basic salivary proline-rich protein 4-like [Neogale vison]
MGGRNGPEKHQRAGARHRSIPEPRPGGKRPPGESGPTRAQTSPPAATRHGSGQQTQPLARQQGRRRTAAGEWPRTHALARTREPHVPDASQARRDPPPTRRGEAQAAAPSRIAREGFLTEGASPPPIRPPDRAPRNGVPKASKGLGAGVGLRPCSHHRPEGTSCLHRGHERSGDGHSMLGKNSSSPRVAKRHSAGPARHEGLGKLGEKIGGDDQDPTRARGRNPRAIHGLPREAHAGPQPPGCDTEYVA